MGNSFICSPLQYFDDIKINICYQTQTKERKDNQLVIILDKNKYEGKMNKLKNYFNESEKDIFNSIYKKKSPKKHLNIKKHINELNRLSENKYELMLKILLEQKKIKRKGPKRRETIRNGEKIKITVNELLLKNLNDIKNNKIKNEYLFNNYEEDLLIKNINNLKYRNSATIEKKSIITNKINNKLKNDNYYFHYRNTINEIINEGSGFSNLCKKQTEQSNSPQNKRSKAN